MLDLWIVGIFLLITLVVGIWQGRGMTNFSVFSIAEKKYSTAVLVATITATFLGGSASLGRAEKTFQYGAIFFFVALGDVIKTFIQAKFIATNIDKYSDCISVGDIIGKSYGKNAKLFTGIAGTLTYITLLGAQVSSIGYVFHYFLGTTHVMGVLIGCSILIIYSVFGGIKAVTTTDVIQFIVLIVAIPIVCNIGISQVGGYGKLIESLPATHINLGMKSQIDIMKNIDVFLVFVLSLTGPASVQRLLMAKNSTQASQAFYYTAAICLLFFAVVCCIGLTAKVLKPDLDPVLAMPYIIELLPVGFKGVAIAGLIAIIMSTADSILNTTSVMFVNDIVAVLVKKKLSDMTQLRLAQFSTLLIGIFSIVAAFSFKSVFDIMVLSKLFWTPVVVIPFVAGVTGFIVDRKSFWVGAFWAVIIAIVWQIFKLEKTTGFGSILPAMLANFIFFFGSHYYYKLFKQDRFEPIPNLSINEPIGGKKILVE
jgi:SSS family solute:Na+ symporter